MIFRLRFVPLLALGLFGRAACAQGGHAKPSPRKPAAKSALSAQAKAQLNAALFNAVEADNVARADNLIRQGASVGAGNAYNLPPLALAVLDGKLAMVKLLVAKGSRLNTRVRGSDTLLVNAIDRSLLDVALVLVNAGADVNIPDEEHRTPLMYLSQMEIPDAPGYDLTKLSPAQRQEAKEITSHIAKMKQTAGILTRALIAHGANPNKVAPGGYLPLLLAAEHGTTEVALALLQSGADPKLIQKPFNSPLRSLCRHGAAGGLDEFIRDWTDGSLSLEEKNAVLGRAEAKDVEVAALMLDKGAQLSSGDSRFALAEAAQQGHEKMVKLLLEHGADPNIALVPEKITLTPIERIERRLSAEEAAKEEKEMNASNDRYISAQAGLFGFDTWPRTGQTPLLLASARGHADVVQQLLDKDADAAKRDNLGRTALWQLASGGRTATIFQQESSYASIGQGKRNMGWLGYDIAAPLPEKQTHELLQWATQGDGAVATALLAHGCPADLPDNKGVTPLQIAALQSSPTVVEVLLNTGAELPTSGEPLLHRVLTSGRRQTRTLPMLSILQLVFVQMEEIEAHPQDAGGDKSYAAELAGQKARFAKIRAEMFRQRSQLLTTWGEQDAAVIQLLLQHGQAADAKDASGLTPLMRCARLGQFEVARVLLQAGADVNAVDANGETVLTQVVAHGLRQGSIQSPRAFSDQPAKATTAKIPIGRATLIRQAWGQEDASFITLLLQHGAEKERKDKTGRTAAAWATQLHHIEAIAALK